MMLEVLRDKMYKNLTIVLVLFVLCSTKVDSTLVNQYVERVMDLSSQLVRITSHITLENTGKDSVKTFLFTLEPDTEVHFAYIHSVDKQENELKTSKIPATLNSKGIFYNVELKHFLHPGDTVVVNVETVFTQSLIPYPNTIAQKDKQLVRYFGNHYYYSPYETTKQITNIALNSKIVDNYSKLKPVSQTDSVINYGPYEDIPPYSFDEMMLHFESNAPFLTVTRLERIIDVSHWGSISVTENINILHTGAKLKGSFSRYDYQRETNSNHHSIKSYKTYLPATAEDIYYRDTNGNISTSQVRERKDWIEVELRPRYPLFGGWKSAYTLGYSVPSYEYIFCTADKQYMLKMPLLDHVFDDMYVQELETSIILPVGVSNITVDTPYPTERLSNEFTYKYLDARGRVVIKLRNTNLVEQHIQDFSIKYSWSSFHLFYEPIVVSLALSLLFFIVIIYVRLDFTINPTDHIKKD